MRNYFEFQNKAKINCGEGALKTLGAELSYLGGNKPLLVCSQEAVKDGVIDPVLSAISSGNGAGVVCFDGIGAAVSTDLIRELKNTFEKEECDSIIAVGGDSVLDSAKVLRTFLSQKCDDILPIAGVLKALGNRVPMILIPTDCGSGAETNGFVTIGDQLMQSAEMIPDLVIIDAAISVKETKQTFAGKGYAALSNAVEAYLGADGVAPVEIFAEKSIKLIFENLIKSIKDPKDAAARSAVLLSSALAGIAFGNVPFGRAHALAEGICTVTGKMRYEALALSLVPALKAERKTERLETLLLWVAGEQTFAETEKSERADKVIDAIAKLSDDLFEETGLANKISITDVPREAFGAIAEAAQNSRAAITDLRTVGKDEFIAMLNEAY